MAKKRGLGRGLSSLIPPSDASEAQEGGLLYASIEAISPNPQQPRSRIDNEKLAELALSIKEDGLIQPLIVTQVTDGQYTLIAGERRWRSAE